MTKGYKPHTEETGLITPDNLPDKILHALSCVDIQTLGHYLFEQLINQRNYTGRKMKPIDFLGCDHMPVDDFIGSVKDGMFTDDDGHGKYATDKEVSDIMAIPSKVAKGKVREEWTHVCWYNR